MEVEVEVEADREGERTRQREETGGMRQTREELPPRHKGRKVGRNQSSGERGSTL